MFHSPGTPGQEGLDALTRVGGVQMELPAFARAMVLLDGYRQFQQRWKAERCAPAARAVGVAGCDRHTPLPALLQAFGIRQPGEVLVQDADGAARAAAALGFPVAMKIDSPDIAHKTEAGGVVLSVDSQDAARSAFARIMETVRVRAPQARLAGVQIQQMAPPGREMIVGLVRDPDFGPMVMLGFGGIYAEVLRDTVFELSPLTLSQAGAMIERLRGVALLDGVRGEPAADKAALARLLVAVGDMASQADLGIRELDLNPVIVYPEGQGLYAVDALLVRDGQD
ncbi:MAG: acetate--CoA ligase family protein [Pseudorhodoferax sp.]